MPDNETDSTGGSDRTWHPASEWLEEGVMTDSRPAQEASEDDGDWEDEMDSEDNHPGFSITDGNPHIAIGNIEIELTADDSQVSEDLDSNGGHPRVLAPGSGLFELIAASGLQHLLHSYGWTTAMDEHEGEQWEPDEDDPGDEAFMSLFRYRPRARGSGEAPKYPPVPHPEGKKLMREGHFGVDEHYVDRLKKRKNALATRLMWRELGVDTYGVQKRAGQSISQGLIPGSVTDRIIHYDTRSYSGQFSDDGNFFFCCAQDFKVRMYDTSNPSDWKYYKTVDYPFGRWTITDATLSPDNRFLAYSSIKSQVYMALTDPEDSSDPTVLDFCDPISRPRVSLDRDDEFGIWSLRFSGDGREIVAGTSDDSIIVYDVERMYPVLTMRDRHLRHVNAVCYGDTSSPHILYSGSDDSTIRVWDRRSMGDGREAGAFLGHTEGLTYVDSKGDGRYVLSNSKDQTMKLWDLRKMLTSADVDEANPLERMTGFDYRFDAYPDRYRKDPRKDCSVVTYRGHRVLKTLIRCHFSPPDSTNSRYVYSGSEDGKVYVYNLDATLAGTIDVGKATANSRPRDPEAYATAYEMSGDMVWRTCVRDASWHPSAPVLAGRTPCGICDLVHIANAASLLATSWNGWGLSTGTCTVHSWNAGATEDEGYPAPADSYDDKLRSIPEFNRYRKTAPRSRRPLRSRPVRRWIINEDAEDTVW
ncbi:uncharacterized protein N7515_008014 [Penicillium bovifimosum]|uniref:WD repeat protein n=1 Tax=Penicillium bovifimosum TaxID=126998 RepID=A0A9W9GMG4_9EURO|nr:uncharacterized protein N7515_008014 [Penicillium bovifimosum]KAJ5124189.1 hypothetical protein N7515_008014 [Penicillium bovifimosum]